MTWMRHTHELFTKAFSFCDSSDGPEVTVTSADVTPSILASLTPSMLAPRARGFRMPCYFHRDGLDVVSYTSFTCPLSHALDHFTVW